MSSLPVSHPGLSYWQRTTRAFPHLYANQDTPVPSSSPYVVIGSGITGALLAFELIQSGVPGKDIVLLEAREAASGASSRNAGHVRPDAFRGFQLYARLHGAEQAVKILANERLVLETVDQFVRTHHVPCDFQHTTTFDVCMTPAFADLARTSLEAYRAAGGDVAHVRVYTGDEAAAKTRIRGAVAAYEWPAGSSHPAKLAQWLLTAVLDKGARLFTDCPVTEVSEAGAPTSSTPLWDVHTPRGVVRTPAVVHCTNAYVSHLLPQLGPHVVPTRAQAHAVVSGPGLSGGRALASTYSLRYSLSHFYSIIQRAGDGTLILGCSRPHADLPAAVHAGTFTTDDSRYSEAIADDALAHLAEMLPDAGLGPPAPVHGAGLAHAWNGIVGLTSDHVPFLGPVDGKPGQFVCAGFNGHGMARIFTAAPGVVKLMMKRPWSETGLPECFQYSQARVDKLTAAGVRVHKEPL